MRSPVGPHRVELGDTDDPTALVPGDPGALFAYVEQYRDAASGCERAANALTGLRQVDGWEGESADAFAQRVTTMVKAWDDLAEKLNAAAGAWEQYATVLGWGQQKAGDAIAMFAHAAALTSAAAGESPAQLGPRGYTGPGTRASPDPGWGARADARSLLAYARESVADAAAEAASVLRGIAPPVSTGGGWNAPADAANALIENPDALLQIIGGAAMMTGGAALFGGGLAADVTVAGAVVGVPANAIGAAAMASGTALASAGIMNAAAHASGASNAGNDRRDGRDARGRFTGKGSRPWVDKEKIGIEQVERDFGVEIKTERRAARVDGTDRSRFFDGFFKNEDGTYTAVEVKSGGASRTAGQREFDGLVSRDNPAIVKPDGETVRVTSIYLKRVP